MERGPFLEPEVQKAFGRFVEIRLHTDGRDAAHAESSARNKAFQQRRFKTIALPYYALLSPDGSTVYWEEGGVLGGEAFRKALDAVPGR